MTDKKKHSNAPGTMPIWILEFHGEPSDSSLEGAGKTKRQAHFYIPYPKGTEERKAGRWLDATELKKTTQQHEENLKKMDQFCQEIEEKAKATQSKNSDLQKKLRENIDNLGDIVARFNDLLRRFQQKKPPESSS